jgi:diguanylate cyclase (GGDEF)-like protein/PAS domain S-box-containing protein
MHGTSFAIPSLCLPHMGKSKGKPRFESATLRWLNDVSAHGILITDGELKITGWNRWLEDHSGCTAAEMVGRDLLEAYPSLRERGNDQHFTIALAGQVVVLAERPLRYLLPMLPSDPESEFELMQQSARIAPLLDDDKVIGTITLIEDVTERVERERIFERQMEALRSLEESNARLQQTLRESEHRYRSLSDLSLVGVYLIQDGVFRYVNPSFARMFGYEPDDMIGKMEPLTVVAPEDQETVGESLKRRLAGKVQRTHHEFRGLRKDGTLCHAESFGVAVAYEDRPAVLGTCLDVTQRKQAEQTLRESEERFRQLAENVRDVFWIGDIASGEVLYVSPAYEQIWGRPCGDLYTRSFSWTDAIHPEDRDQVAYRQGRALEEQQEFEAEYRIVRPDGTVRHIHDRGFPVRDEAGRVYRMAGIAADVTDRKHTEDAFRQSEAQFRAMSNAAPVGIFVTDASGHCLYSNAVFQTMSGLTAGEILGTGWVEALHPEDRERVFGEWYDAAHGQQPYSSVHRFLRADGRTVWVSARAAPIQDGDQVIGYVGAVEDITERRKAQEELERANAILRGLSLTDELTGLYNRRGFQTLGDQHLKSARRTGQPLVLIFADMDGLKEINDTLGHDDGDVALRRVAEVFRASVRESDVVARMGGDEFAVLASDVQGDGGRTITNRLEEKLTEYNTSGSLGYTLSVSFGVVYLPADRVMTIDEALVQADEAMYADKKKKGRGRPVLPARS